MDWLAPKATPRTNRQILIRTCQSPSLHRRTIQLVRHCGHSALHQHCAIRLCQYREATTTGCVCGREVGRASTMPSQRSTRVLPYCNSMNYFNFRSDASNNNGKMRKHNLVPTQVLKRASSGGGSQDESDGAHAAEKPPAGSRVPTMATGLAVLIRIGGALVVISDSRAPRLFDRRR